MAIGATGARTPAPAWPIVEIELGRLSGFARLAAIARQLTTVLGRRAALSAYWSDWRRRAILRAAEAEHADVYVAREWRTLPIAIDVADACGARVVMDSPELSADEKIESLAWRVFFRPQIVAIERTLLPRTHLVTAVSAGIGNQLYQRYGLRSQPTTVRNMPPYQEHQLRPATDAVQVLFLGGIVPSRGIEQVLDSVASWPTEWRLTLRGPGDPAYIERLRTRAPSEAHRITFAPPVPLTEMVRVAAESDVGILAQQPNGLQSDESLPNKLFEYLMAGLAVCVSGLPAMRDVVESTKSGVLIDAPYGSAEVTAAVARLASLDIDDMKRHALAAARTLCWDNESRIYVEAFAAAFGAP